MNSADHVQADALEDDLTEDEPTRPLYLTPQTHHLPQHLPTPGSSPRPPRPSYLRNRSSKSHPSSLAPLDLPLLTSASEIFSHMVPPPIARHTTYSSLPPSPVHDFDVKSRGLGIRELEDVLGHLDRQTPDHVEDEFLSAESSGNETDRQASTKEVDETRDREGDARSPSPGRFESLGRLGKEGLSLWELLKDERGTDDWEGWVVDGKW